MWLLVLFSFTFPTLFDFFVTISLIFSWLWLFQATLLATLTWRSVFKTTKGKNLSALRTDPSFQHERERKGEMKESEGGWRGPWVSRVLSKVVGGGGGVCRGGASVSSNLSPFIEDQWHTHTNTYALAPLVLHDGSWQLCAQAGASKRLWIF